MKNNGIQVLRAVAALLVLLQHAYYFSGLSVGDPVLGFRKLGLGSMGVFIFFAISGAVMAMARENGPWQFGVNRLLRIYPPYLASLGLAFAVLLAMGAPAPRFTLDASLLLIPTGTLNSSFQVPYWTLIYEVFFYFILFLLYLVRATPGQKCWFIVAWVFAIELAFAAGMRLPVAAPPPSQMIFASSNLYFAFGYLMGHAARGRSHLPLTVATIGTGFLGFYFSAVAPAELARMVLVVGVLLIAMTMPDGFAPAWMTRMGDCSYGLYLMHMPIVVGVHYVSKANHWGFALTLLTTLLAGGAGGLLFGKAEQFIYTRWLRRSFGTSRTVAEA